VRGWRGVNTRIGGWIAGILSGCTYHMSGKDRKSCKLETRNMYIRTRADVCII
jgi:hypothetical protein